MSSIRASESTTLLSVERLEKGFLTGKGTRLEVLKGVSLEVAAGEVVAVVGESGTGKSTLLHVLGALDRPDGGKVLYNGEDIFDQSDDALSRFRNRSIGFVFQFHYLLPEFTALENVAMPALIQGVARRRAYARAAELLMQLGLAERSEHRPSALSGGEQQRVAVARALMNEPALVLADEPSGSLDTRTAEGLHRELLALSRKKGQTFVIATHNPLLSSMCDRVLRLESGVLVPVEPTA